MLIDAVGKFVALHTGLAVKSVGMPVMGALPVIVTGFGKTKTVRVKVEYRTEDTFTLVGFGEHKTYVERSGQSNHPLDKFT